MKKKVNPKKVDEQQLKDVTEKAKQQLDEQKRVAEQMIKDQQELLLTDTKYNQEQFFDKANSIKEPLKEPVHEEIEPQLKQTQSDTPNTKINEPVLPKAKPTIEKPIRRVQPVVQKPAIKKPAQQTKPVQPVSKPAVIKSEQVTKKPVVPVQKPVKKDTVQTKTPAFEEDSIFAQPKNTTNVAPVKKNVVKSTKQNKPNQQPKKEQDKDVFTFGQTENEQYSITKRLDKAKKPKFEQAPYGNRPTVKPVEVTKQEAKKVEKKIVARANVYQKPVKNNVSNITTKNKNDIRPQSKTSTGVSVYTNEFNLKTNTWEQVFPQVKKALDDRKEKLAKRTLEEGDSKNKNLEAIQDHKKRFNIKEPYYYIDKKHNKILYFDGNVSFYRPVFISKIATGRQKDDFDISRYWDGDYKKLRKDKKDSSGAGVYVVDRVEQGSAYGLKRNGKRAYSGSIDGEPLFRLRGLGHGKKVAMAMHSSPSIKTDKQFQLPDSSRNKSAGCIRREIGELRKEYDTGKIGLHDTIYIEPHDEKSYMYEHKGLIRTYINTKGKHKKGTYVNSTPFYRL